MKSLLRIARIAASLSLVLGMSLAHALDRAPYSAEAIASAQAAGKPFALHFHANWCPTCRAQENVFRDIGHASALPMTLYVVDYDKERALKQQLGVRTQSTLIVYRGNSETARSAGEVDAAKLRAALQSAL